MSEANKTGNDTGDNTVVNEPELAITNVDELTRAVAQAVASPSDKPSKMYSRNGFKSPASLEGISSSRLAQMAGLCIRQIVRNGGTEVKPVLGAISKFGPVCIDEEALSEKLSSYETVAKDLGIARGKDETTAAFLERVGGAIRARAK